MPPLHVAVVIGTRPEAIKMAPVILALRERPAEFRLSVVRTGQHRELVDQLMGEFGIATDVNLDLMQPNQQLAHVMAESVRGLSAAWAELRPDWVLVQGDTTTTLAGALAAFYNGAKVGHVEAGLRTGHRRSPFPEEANRALTARLSDLHFAPTEGARQNLLREGIADADVIVTGNTVVDALWQTLSRPAPDSTARRPASGSRYLLVTAHRRENQGPALHDICDGVLALLDSRPDVSAWVPMHPSPAVRDVLIARLADRPRVFLTEALGYTEFVHALHGAALVLSDSGGVQEECAALGKPVLVMRNDTERPEAVDAGVAVLVGTASARIADVGGTLLDDVDCYRSMARPSDAFGAGQASARILAALVAAPRLPGAG